MQYHGTVLCYPVNGPITLFHMFHMHKKALKIQNCAYTYRVELMSSVAYDQRMSAYDQHMTSVWPAYSAYC